SRSGSQSSCVESSALVPASRNFDIILVAIRCARGIIVDHIAVSEITRISTSVIGSHFYDEGVGIRKFVFPLHLLCCEGISSTLAGKSEYDRWPVLMLMLSKMSRQIGCLLA